jgi:hypothetical protein
MAEDVEIERNIMRRHLITHGRYKQAGGRSHRGGDAIVGVQFQAHVFQIFDCEIDPPEGFDGSAVGARQCPLFNHPDELLAFFFNERLITL